MNKRILSLVTVLVMILTMLASMTSALAYYAVYSKCPNGKALNVRSGPGKEYDVIDRIPYGDAIYVVGETSPGWLQLNDFGYVQASLTSRNYPGAYVAPEKKTTDKSTKTATASEPMGYDLLATAVQVTPYTITLQATQNSKGVANVRWAPAKSAPLLRAYPSGTRVQVIAEMKNWYQVMDENTMTVGFVNIAYVAK